MIVHPYIVENQDKYIFADPTLELHAKYLEEVREATFFSNVFTHTTVYFNGATYFTWYKSSVNDNSQASIVKYVRDEQLQTVYIGSGTTSPEPGEHPAPTVYINESTGYIYFFQNQFHQTPVRVWKSDNVLPDISAFTLLGTFGSSLGYLMFLEGSGLNVVLLSRGVGGGGANNNYCQSIYKLNVDTLVNTAIQITSIDYATNNTRHYPSGNPYVRYGTATKMGWIISHRDDGTLALYKFSLLITDVGDYELIHNIDNTFSKNVVSVAPITEAELETNFALVGTDSARSTAYQSCTMQLDDYFYFLYRTGSTKEIWRIDLTTGTTITQTITISGTSLSAMSMNWNGTNIILNLYMDGENVVAKINTDLTGYSEFADDLSGVNGIALLPYNFPDIVTDNAYYPIIGYQPLVGQDYIIGYYESNKHWT